MTDEHARFITTGYTEARWQQLLRSRERFRLKMVALRDWSYEQDMLSKPNSGTSTVKENMTVVMPKMVIPKVSPALTGRI
jgi:hypothetical protein